MTLESLKDIKPRYVGGKGYSIEQYQHHGKIFDITSEWVLFILYFL